jgi:hypothetical protein
VTNFVKLLVDSLGLLPFTEKRLSMTVANNFELVATPSQRSDRSDASQGFVAVPLHHLFLMLCTIPPGGEDDASFSEFFLSTFDPFFAGKSASGRGELANELLSLIPNGTLSGAAPWILAAKNCAILSEARTARPESTTTGTMDRSPGPEYRRVASLLERGLQSHLGLPATQWLALIDSLLRQVKEFAGDAGCAIVIIEPLARVLLDRWSASHTEITSLTLVATRSVFEAAKAPRDRQAVDAARRRLWGVPLGVSKNAQFDPYGNLYKLGNAVSRHTYDSFGVETSDSESAQAITAICGFMTRLLSQLGITALTMLQDGFRVWIKDEGAHLHMGDEPSLGITVS